MIRHVREETAETLHRKQLRKLIESKSAFAIPVTYLILFVSLVAIISATYSFAITKIGARGSLLKASVAKQNMQVLDNAVHSVAWSFGASEVVYMDDCGGTFETDPTTSILILNFTDEQSLSEIVFNSSIGKVSYELEPSEFNYEGLFIRGDYAAIINQSEFTMTQLHFETGNDAKQLTLTYRPFAAAGVIGTSNGKPLNLIRVHVINLNSSQDVVLREKFYLKVTSLTVTTITRQYNFDGPVSSLAVKAIHDEVSSVVWLPISSNSQGAVVNLETVICNVKIQKAEV